MPQIGLSLPSTERKLQCSIFFFFFFFRVHRFCSRRTHAGVAYRGTLLEMGLVFQLRLYHKLESPAQSASVKSCPRCEHTLDLAQSVFCSGPQARNGLRHRCRRVLHSSLVGKKLPSGLQNQHQRPGGIQVSQLFRDFCVRHMFSSTLLTLVSPQQTRCLMKKSITSLQLLSLNQTLRVRLPDFSRAYTFIRPDNHMCISADGESSVTYV